MHEYVLSWLRLAEAFSPFGSQSWKNIQNTLPIILQWMAWKLSSRHSILVGRDAILGMGRDSFLSQDLVNYLNRGNIHLLFQANRITERGTLGQSWYNTIALGLEVNLAVEWDIFRRNLIDIGIVLMDRPDELIWTRGDMLGQISVKNVYEALSNKLWRYKIGGWRSKLWTWDCSLKLKLFV